MRESTWREEGRTENRHEKARTTAGFFNKECLIAKYSDFLAETEGFEPSIQV